MNEAWVLEGGPACVDSDPREVLEFRESYRSGKLKAIWSAGISGLGRYVLEGRQVFYYENGQKQWESTFHAGRKAGIETWCSQSGARQWERSWEADGAWTWSIFDSPCRVRAESSW